MLRKSRLNNMILHNLRNETVYEAVMADLYLLGAISKKTAEGLTGRMIPDGLQLPLGITSEADSES